MQPRKFNSLTSLEKKTLIERLNKTDNMYEFLKVLNDVFELRTCTPPSITKNIISSSMVNTVLPMINPQIK